ncbi:hypothetical protein HDV01_003740 [Terramyces sp. JEL0728]|nr:hypothetical protein HDV01_003740 [Terramyces sp. JEL0728]
MVNVGYMVYRMVLYNATEDSLSLNAIPLTLVSNIILYGIDLINLQTLNLFSVLDSRITRPKIIIITVMFSVLFVWSEIIYIVNWAVYDGENMYYYPYMFWVVVSILYDTCQGIFLAFLLYKRFLIKGGTINRQNVNTSKNTIGSLLSMLLFLSFLDWVAAGVFSVGNLNPSLTVQLYFNNVASSIQGLHIFGITLIFKHFTDLIKQKASKKAAPRRQPINSSIKRESIEPTSLRDKPRSTHHL